MSKSFSTPKLLSHFSVELLLILAITIGILLRLLNLGSREFWYDEVLSLLLSTGQKLGYETPADTPVTLADYTALLSLPVESGIGDVLNTLKDFLKGLVGSEPHPPLFFLGEHLWLRLFGHSEAAMRSLITLVSLAAIGSAYGLGRFLMGNRGGLLFAALLATNPFFLFHSLNVRMYGPLVLWTILSTWALLQLIEPKKLGIKTDDSDTFPIALPFPPSVLWTILLIGSVSAGLLTFYLFAYWLVTLAVLVFYLDRQRWWPLGWRIGAGVWLTFPWVVWGMRQQLRNADLNRFAAKKGFIAAGIQHLQDAAQTLGIHLVLGDWITSIPLIIAAVAGVAVIVLLFAGVMNLWRQGERQRLGIALIMGLFPLLIALGLDVTTKKFTLGFGFGRSLIFILPGCLLLLTLWVHQTAERWQRPVIAVLLLLYLSISIGDYSLRPRGMFHSLANLIQQEPTTPTLLVMNSLAWGHVMRLAYYIPPTAPVMLLARESDQLAPSLEKALTAEPERYQRILWLEAAKPVWSPPSTDAERQQVQQVLNTHFCASPQSCTSPQAVLPLSGTMDLDKFSVNLYQRSAETK